MREGYGIIHGFNIDETTATWNAPGAGDVTFSQNGNFACIYGGYHKPHRTNHLGPGRGDHARIANHSIAAV